ncbi:MAG TPA: oligopeptide/dipeptide ABC transporter ATP-binding protein [Rhizobiaceae bacterium]|nr:oligopeptide/dipeptide ABC transporter ATP-binding protein [Rhizobiaceae bacterium]
MLELRDVECTFQLGGQFSRRKRTIHAVRGVNLTVRRGEVLGLVGESGSGKSTLARIVLGLQPPTKGEVYVAGRRLDGFAPRELARIVQPIFQDPYSSLNPKWRVRDILALPLNLHKVGARSEREGRVEETLRRCGLDSQFLNAFPAQLSGGQRQRVAIARALILNPDLVICDEPTSALDVSVQAQILNLLHELRETMGLTFVFISHNLAVVDHMSTRVCVMYLGKLVEQAEAATIFAKPKHPYTSILMNSVLTPEPGLGLPAVNTVAQQSDNSAAGCSFYPRCPQRFEPCATVEPRTSFDRGHGVDCHLYRSSTDRGAAVRQVTSSASR